MLLRTGQSRALETGRSQRKRLKRSLKRALEMDDGEFILDQESEWNKFPEKLNSENFTHPSYYLHWFIVSWRVISHKIYFNAAVAVKYRIVAISPFRANRIVTIVGGWHSTWYHHHRIAATRRRRRERMRSKSSRRKRNWTRKPVWRTNIKSVNISGREAPAATPATERQEGELAGLVGWESNERYRRRFFHFSSLSSVPANPSTTSSNNKREIGSADCVEKYKELRRWRGGGGGREGEKNVNGSWRREIEQFYDCELGYCVVNAKWSTRAIHLFELNLLIYVVLHTFIYTESSSCR